MIPPHPLQLFSPDWYRHVDTRTQVDRLPGVDAPCMCAQSPKRCALKTCHWPFCTWKPPNEEDE